MQTPGYIDWLFSEDKKPFYIDTNGLVVEGDPVTLLKPDGNPAKLQFSPDGWRDTLIKYGRSLTYWGLFREFTVPMRFTKDGAAILRAMHWAKGMEGIVYFGKSKLDRRSYPNTYEAWFLGEIDLSKFKQRQQDQTVTANVMEGGLSKLLEANENTVYDIRIDTDVGKKTLYLDGIPFTNRVEYTVYSGQQIAGSPGIQFRWLGMGIIESEGTTQGIITQDVQLVIDGSFPNEHYFLWSIDKYISVNVSGTISGQYEGSGGVNPATIHCRITKVKDNAVVQEIAVNTGGPYGEGATFSFSFNENIDVAPGERLYIRISVQPDTLRFFDINSGTVVVKYDVTFDPTFCEGLSAYTLFERLVTKLTNGKYGVKSTFLQSRDDLFYTSGPALRKYGSEASIKTTVADFFQETKLRGLQRYGVGLAIENNMLIIEELNYFFRSDVIIDLGIVDDLEVSQAEDIQINTIKTGYRNQTIDKVNGRDEFNVTQVYTTPHTRIVREMNIVSPYRADMYGIEVTRVDLRGKDTTDNKADNDTFVISVEKKDSVEVQYYNGDFQTEVSAGQYYIKIPRVLSQIPNGLNLAISGSVANNGTFTVENTSYLVAGFTIIRVTQAVTNEAISFGVIVFMNTYMYNLLRRPYTTVSGLLHPDESFNIELSPKRALLNNGSLIRSLLDKHDSNSIIFQSGEKNSDLLTILAPETVEEKANVAIGSLKDKLFLPYYFNFSTQVPVDFLSIMKTNPYGKIKFTDGKTGVVLYGYTWDGGIKPEPNDKQTWKLIAANQDLSKLK